MDDSRNPAQRDVWHALRQLTPARIALGRAGGSVPTAALLDFQMAHAVARDAVHQAFDAETLQREIASLGQATALVQTQAADRRIYLQNPDLGRRLSDASRQTIELLAAEHPEGFDLCVIVSDGLSAAAAHRQAEPLLRELLPALHDWKLAPIIIVRFGRVALQDEIGQILRARLAVILLGERPGLGAPDSLGAYLIHNPRLGATDADRNCISNIRPEGLLFRAAAEKLLYLLHESRRRQLSGVQLKDERPRLL